MTGGLLPLIPLGDASAAACEGDACVIPVGSSVAVPAESDA
jgi:hypothetical protein